MCIKKIVKLTQFCKFDQILINNRNCVRKRKNILKDVLLINKV